jgi:hypothetical protein
MRGAGAERLVIGGGASGPAGGSALTGLWGAGAAGGSGVLQPASSSTATIRRE